MLIISNLRSIYVYVSSSSSSSESNNNNNNINIRNEIETQYMRAYKCLCVYIHKKNNILIEYYHI